MCSVVLYLSNYANEVPMCVFYLRTIPIVQKLARSNVGESHGTLINISEYIPPSRGIGLLDP